jgi:hypothetical protein
MRLLHFFRKLFGSCFYVIYLLYVCYTCGAVVREYVSERMTACSKKGLGLGLGINFSPPPPTREIVNYEVRRNEDA